MENFNLAATLKAYREEKGYSIREMADILHMSKSAYDRLEKCLTQPTYGQIQRILELSQIKPDTFREIDTKGKPVGTIAYLMRGLLYGSISTEVALNCFRDIGEALKCQPLLQWAKRETEGYFTDMDQIPDYRLFVLSYDIEYQQDGKKYFMSLPSDFLTSPEDSFCTRWPHPIDEADEICASGGKLVVLTGTVPCSLEVQLQKVYGPDLHLIRSAGSVSAQLLQKVLLAVQEIMLRFLLYVETEFGPGADIGDLSTHRYRLGILFQNMLDTVGFAGHLDLPMKPKTQEEVILIKGDEDRFLDWLDQHDISIYEQDEFFVLREAVEEVPAPEGMVPPEMCDWAKKVTSSNWRFRQDDKKLINGLKVLYGVEE